MKKVLAILFLLQTVFCYSEEIKSVLGVPFGSSRKEALEILIAKGWGHDSEDDYDSSSEDGDTDSVLASMQFTNGKFAGKKVKIVELEFLNDRMYSCEIQFESKGGIEEIIASYRKRYNLEYMETPFSSDWYLSQEKDYYDKTGISYTEGASGFSVFSRIYMTDRRSETEIETQEEPEIPSQEEIDADI